MLIKKLLPSLLLLGLLFSSKAQISITDTLSTKYFPATEAPDINWNQPNFNDGEWNDIQGINIFGYGDIDYLEIPKVPSIYVRSFFNVDTLKNFKELMMFCDFDDGFVAYLNGVEFARVNMGKQFSNTTYDQLADRSHEMAIAQGVENVFPVMGYYLDSLFLDTVLVTGQNVVSIEVHNDSINGSDLGFYHEMFNLTYSEYSYSNFYTRYKKCIELEKSNLPVFIVETDEYGIPFANDKDWESVKATLKIINNNNGQDNIVDAKSYELESNIKIRYRGESSRMFPKRPYKFELKDEEWKDTSISLLGLPREADWILQGPFADKSQIRNTLTYEFGRKTGRYAPRTKTIELIVNGEYVGVYNLVEQIKRDSGRVNIAKLREEEISGTDLTGGYILKYDKPVNSKIMIVYPKEKNIQDEQETYIRDFLAEYDDVLFSNDGLDPNIGYKKYIDEASLIDYVIVSELAKNADSYRYSTYFYKDKDDRDPRIKFGPLWDFDLGFGNTTFQDGHKTDGWQFEFAGSNKFNIKRLFEDPELVDDFQERWFELRQSFLHTDSIFARIDELTNEYSAAIERNYKVWPVIDEIIFFQEGYVADSYKEEIDGLKNWIQGRADWIDANINEIYYPISDFTSIDDIIAYNSNQFSSVIYPNPIKDHFIMDLNMPKSGLLAVEIIDITGKIVSIIEPTQVDKGNYKVIWKKDSEQIKPGLHILNLKLNNESYYQDKIIFH